MKENSLVSIGWSLRFLRSLRPLRQFRYVLYVPCVRCVGWKPAQQVNT